MKGVNMAGKISADIAIIGASQILTLRGANGPRARQEMEDIGIVKNGVLALKGENIVFVGGGREAYEGVDLNSAQIINASGKVVMPGFVDCHTHAVFAGSREEEFMQKVRGVPYLDILARGGGILDTVRKVQKASFDHLVEIALKRLALALRCGTTTMEVKSGYGLSRTAEIKILGVVRELQRKSQMDLVPTFLGAHALPPNVSRTTYLKEVLGVIAYIKQYGLAEYCDVFCEKEAFSTDEACQIFQEAKSCGMKIKIHAGEFNDIGAVRLGAEMQASSIDHLDYVSEDQMRMMAEKKIVGVLLPGVPFHLMLQHYAPARRLIELGVPVAIATDFNPGSCPTLSMQMTIALACRYMKMTPAEAVTASTINAAWALDRGQKIGSLEVGKRADVMVLSIPDYRQLPYWFGFNLVETVLKNGKVVISQCSTIR